MKLYPWIWHVNVIRIRCSLINNAHLDTFQCAAQISSLDCNTIWNSDRNPAHTCTSRTSSILIQTSHVSRCHQHTKTHRNATTVGQAAFLLGYPSKESKRHKTNLAYQLISTNLYDILPRKRIPYWNVFCISTYRVIFSQHKTVRVYSKIMTTRNSDLENSGWRFPGLWKEKVHRSPQQMRNQNTSTRWFKYDRDWCV